MAKTQPRPKVPSRTPLQQKAKERTKAADIAGLKGKETTTMAAAALVDPDKPLTQQQRMFVKFWAEGDTIPNAMHRAGYNDQPSYGYRMAKMPNILVLFNKVKAQYEEAAQMTRKKVMDMLVESYEMAKLMAEPATMVSAAREVGRMCGYYEPTKVKIEVTHSTKLETLSDAELYKIIHEAEAVQAQVELLGDGSDGDESD